MELMFLKLEMVSFRFLELSLLLARATKLGSILGLEGDGEVSTVEAGFSASEGLDTEEGLRLSTSACLPVCFGVAKFGTLKQQLSTNCDPFMEI